MKEANKGKCNEDHVFVATAATEYDPLEDILAEALEEQKRKKDARSVFNEMDENGNGKITEEQFIGKYFLVDSTLSRDQMQKIFQQADQTTRDTSITKNFNELPKCLLCRC